MTTMPPPVDAASSGHVPVPAPLRAPGRRELVPLGGPGFSSCAGEEVAWLLTDLTGVPLDAAPTALPVEYQPAAEHQRLFEEALAEGARHTARAVGVLTETLIAERGREQPDGFGGNIVLASLLRAGTPVGILIRRWAAWGHGIRLRHYAVSMVRGRGVDPAALRYLAARHDPADVVFVDGWTGRGARTRELVEALDGTPFTPEPAVLADPARCARTFGTREDLLIPSAHLDATVCGLVSRPVPVAEGAFHGARCFRELAGADATATFLEAVTARFEEVRDEAVHEAAELVEADPEDREPDWAAWDAAERIARERGLAHGRSSGAELVRPGVGETIRVLEQRRPLAVLVSASSPESAAAEDLGLRQALALAGQHGVPVERVEGLPVTCAGIVAPD
ncbi:cysteine protease StiP domain-containing protein [Phaeacidiphilus oryzae]|uniref:cysteine protease StiP domain-containing protein n=1 Tax=Phaeacidiphilus oryzae TaxID=348818 RepID=UPI0007C6AFE9|nr:cysteine protease StiP domain-containing protein [Phaeacidiphilus oryzae]